MDAGTDDGTVALEEGRAFLDLSPWRKVAVSGTDAAGWLGDLLTADIAGLGVGGACRSLLLTPTGRIRADVHVASRPDGLLLLQSPDQPEDVGLALASYVLSADVLLEDRTGALALFALPGRETPPVEGADTTAPSCVGTGIDVVTPAGEPARRFARGWGGGGGGGEGGEGKSRRGLEEAGADALERWRIRRGAPRMGADFDVRSIPAETGLDDVIDYGKGCFLGQEAVARVRNLGHPPRVLRHLRTDAPVRVDDPVFVDGSAVGVVTSAAEGAQTTLLARVRWDAATASLVAADGSTLIDVPHPV
jgi:tRNA-modifying protein YgfZ